MGKLLDLRSRLKNKSSENIGEVVSQEVEGEVLSITETRQELIQEERRRVKRTILREFIGAFVVVPEKGLLKVNLFDVSEEGLSFDLAVDLGRFQREEEVAMRVYLSHKAYFPIIVKINYSRIIRGEDVVRHGGLFVKDETNDTALHHFVKFVESVAPSLRKDEGDLLVSNFS